MSTILITGISRSKTGTHCPNPKKSSSRIPVPNLGSFRAKNWIELRISLRLTVPQTRQSSRKINCTGLALASLSFEGLHGDTSKSSEVRKSATTLTMVSDASDRTCSRRKAPCVQPVDCWAFWWNARTIIPQYLPGLLRRYFRTNALLRLYDLTIRDSNINNNAACEIATPPMYTVVSDKWELCLGKLKQQSTGSFTVQSAFASGYLATISSITRTKMSGSRRWRMLL